jgi:hypothetical protein
MRLRIKRARDVQTRLLTVALIEAPQHGRRWWRRGWARCGRPIGHEERLQRSLRLFVGPAGQEHARMLIVRVFVKGAERALLRAEPGGRGTCLLHESRRCRAILTAGAAKDVLQLPCWDDEHLAAARTTPVNGQKLGHVSS